MTLVYINNRFYSEELIVAKYTNPSISIFIVAQVVKTTAGSTGEG